MNNIKNINRFDFIDGYIEIHSDNTFTVVGPIAHGLYHLANKFAREKNLDQSVVLRFLIESTHKVYKDMKNEMFAKQCSQSMLN